MRSIRAAAASVVIGVSIAIRVGSAGAASGEAEGGAASPAGPALARELATAGDHEGAALEYRRLGMEEPSPSARAAWYWMSAYEYSRAGKAGSADRMLDRVADEGDVAAVPTILLQSDLALQADKPDEAAFYLESILEFHAGDPSEPYARRRLASARLRSGRLTEARDALGTEGQEAAQAAIDAYAQGRDRSVALGGLLGLVPGLGYAYSGEYANAVRSLILNGLFIWGMVETAEDEEWGLFAVIGFGELTWYSGSIYGGIDAAHRFNRRRLDAAESGIVGDAGYEPRMDELPVLTLEFRF